MPEGGPADPRTKKVLVVDDDEVILTLLEILVRRDGFQVLTAANGDAAVIALTERPDAILLDLMMPGTVNGLGVLKRLRRLKTKIPPVFIVTAYQAHPEFKEITDDPNVVEVIPKPVNQEKLLFSLHKALKTKAPPKQEFPKPPKKT